MRNTFVKKKMVKIKVGLQGHIIFLSSGQAILPAGDTWHFGRHAVGEVLQSPSERRPAMLLGILQCTGWLPTKRKKSIPPRI